MLKERLSKFTKEAAEVEIKLNKTKETIAAADSLVEGLEGEYKRWNKEVSTMEVCRVYRPLNQNQLTCICLYTR